MEIVSQKYFDIVKECLSSDYADSGAFQIARCAWLISKLSPEWQERIEFVSLSNGDIGIEWRHPQWHCRTDVYLAATAQSREKIFTGRIFLLNGKYTDFQGEITDETLPRFLELVEIALSL